GYPDERRRQLIDHLAEIRVDRGREFLDGARHGSPSGSPITWSVDPCRCWVNADHSVLRYSSRSSSSPACSGPLQSSRCTLPSTVTSAWWPRLEAPSQLVSKTTPVGDSASSAARSRRSQQQPTFAVS